MGHRPANRGLPDRTDAQVLASDLDMALLLETAHGRLVMSPATRTDIRRLVREDLALCGFGTGQVATLLPRGARLLAVARGEFSLSADT